MFKSGHYILAFIVCCFLACDNGNGITKQTPVATDFTIGNLKQTVGNISPVTIVPLSGKSTGTIAIYYNNSFTLPVDAGEYLVTFDVAATTGWNEANRLNAGMLSIVQASGSFGTPDAININFSESLTLAHLSLPEGYTWDAPETTLNAGANQLFPATFIHPSGNYESANGYITVNVLKVEAGFGEHDSINASYTPTLILANLNLETGYVWDTPETALNAGTNQLFPATFTHPSGNFEPANGYIVVNVAKAIGNFGSPDVINTTYTATLTLANLNLETGYTWNTPATILNAGINQLFSATFTHSSGNYEPANGNITVNVGKAIGNFGSPDDINTTYTTTLTLANLNLAAGYTWNDPSTVLNAGNGQLFAAIFVHPSGNYESASGSIAVNVAKANGVAVNSPVLNNKTSNSIVIYAVEAPNNGQTVEYCISTTNIASENDWQEELTFTNTNANVAYYIFARSSENHNFNAGAVSASLKVPVSIENVSMGPFTVTASDASGISWVFPNLTIIESGFYHIKGIGGEVNASIRVLGDNIIADIVLDNVNVNVSETLNAIAFNTNVNNDDRININLTLIGENILKSNGTGAGLAVPSRTNLAITELSTGSLTAIGGNITTNQDGSPGIGGGGAINIYNGNITATGGNCGNTTAHIAGSGISGTVNIFGGNIIATGGNIGVGFPGTGLSGAVNITGGIVTATGGTNATSGRGTGISQLVNLDNSAIIYANSIYPALDDGNNVKNAIVFIGNNVSLFGNVTLNHDLTFSGENNLIINNGKSLTIPNSITLLNNGVIKLFGGIISGTVSGNQPILPGLIISGGSDFSYIGDALTITGDGSYTITMRSDLTNITSESILVASGVNANITLSNVNINHNSAFNMTGATVNLTLIGENTLISGSGMAGLLVPTGSNLIISEASAGSLTVIGGNGTNGRGGGAGIGGNGGQEGINSDGSSGGIIIIKGGIITATGGSGSPICGGSNSRYGGGGGGAGIGGGGGAGGMDTNNTSYFAKSGFSGGTLSITGGIVTATGDGPGSFGGGGTGGNWNPANGGGGAGIGGGGGGGGNGGSVGYLDNGGGGGGAGALSIENNAVLFASVVQPTLTEWDNANNSIAFSGNNGTLYGNVTLQNNITITSGRTLSIPAGRDLNIPVFGRLINNGVINNNGTIYGRNNITGTGSITGVGIVNQ